MVVRQEAGVEKMVEYNENGKLVIPAKAIDDTPKQEPTTEEAVKKDTIAKKKQKKKTHATTKNDNNKVRGKDKDSPEVEAKRERWRMQYETYKQKYRTVWSASWRKKHPKEYQQYLKQQQQKKSKKVSTSKSK